MYLLQRTLLIITEIKLFGGIFKRNGYNIKKYYIYFKWPVCTNIFLSVKFLTQKKQILPN